MNQTEHIIPSDIHIGTLSEPEQITAKQVLWYQTIIVLNQLPDDIDFNVSNGNFTRKIRDLVLRENIHPS